jgi:hypothetical protein
VLLDVIETSLYDAALAGNINAAQFILKHRRREVYVNTDHQQSNNPILNITLAEHTMRMERMGFLVPEIETDYYDKEQLANAPAIDQP